jgi:predicted signal transduction protein with EAL and GGDEF domain
VAEGVESREGWDLLASMGCDLAQGFIVCPPLTSRQFREWLDRRPPEELAVLAAAGNGDGEVDAEADGEVDVELDAEAEGEVDVELDAEAET